VPPGAAIENPCPNRLAEILKELPLERAVLMPCADDWVKAVAELPAELARRFPVSMPPRPIVEAMLDKWRFSELLEREEVPHAKTWLLRSMEEAEALPGEEFEGAFLKPRVSQEFSRRYKAKAFSAKNREEALQLLRKTFEDGMAMVLQEYIPGPLTSHHLIEGFVDQYGRPTWFARQRLRMYPTPFGNSTLTMTVPFEKMAPAAEALRRMFLRTGFRGIFGAEFKYDERDGQFKLLEINARAWWYVEFAERCGLPVCKLAYLDALGQPGEPVEGYKAGRRWVHLSQDYLAYRELRRKGQLNLGSWVRSWLGAEDAMLRWSDPGPFLANLLRARKRLVVHRMREVMSPTAQKEEIPPANRPKPHRKREGSSTPARVGGTVPRQEAR